MGCTESNIDYSAIEKNDNIDKTLQKDKKVLNNTIKLLLLGAWQFNELCSALSPRLTPPLALRPRDPFKGNVIAFPRASERIKVLWANVQSFLVVCRFAFYFPFCVVSLRFVRFCTASPLLQALARAASLRLLSK